MGHCQKFQNNAHLENQTLQKTSDYQSVRLPGTHSCAQVTAQLHFLQQEMSDINHTELKWGCDTSRRRQGGAHPWDPGVHQLQVSAWRKPGKSCSRSQNIQWVACLPKAFCQRQSGHHSKSWFWFQISWASTQESDPGIGLFRLETEVHSTEQGPGLGDTRANTTGSAKQEQTPGTLSQSQTEGSSIKPHSRPAAESHHH